MARRIRCEDSTSFFYLDMAILRGYMATVWVLGEAFVQRLAFPEEEGLGWNIQKALPCI